MEKTGSRDIYRGGVYFAASIPLEQRVALHELICNLDPWSVIGQFAFRRYAPAVGTGTEVIVTKGWHQDTDPHVIVRLQYIFEKTGAMVYVGTAHIHGDGSESVELASEELRCTKEVGVKAYLWYNVSYMTCLVKMNQ
ncbi:Nn.00g091200.m01.CDS01 [Neocucurbitaria sp. VM-36]